MFMIEFDIYPSFERYVSGDGYFDLGIYNHVRIHL